MDLFYVNADKLPLNIGTYDKVRVIHAESEQAVVVVISYENCLGLLPLLVQVSGYVDCNMHA